MAVIEKDGIYRVGDKETGSQIQYLKGTVVPDDAEIEYVGPFPEAPADMVAERNAETAKAADAPATKKAPAPENKSA